MILKHYVHGRLEIRVLPSRFEVSHSFATHSRWRSFQHSEVKVRIDICAPMQCFSFKYIIIEEKVECFHQVLLVYFYHSTEEKSKNVIYMCKHQHFVQENCW